MAKYRIQQRIKTLSVNAVGTASGHPAFTAEDITFTHWDYNHRDGWVVDAWLAEYHIETQDASHALLEFNTRIYKVIPRVSLIAQAYIQYMVQPYLITKEGSDIGFFYYPFDVGAVGLMFQEDEKKALDLLLANNNIPNEFFLYWNDVVNTNGYSSKLLIMFSALEALIRKPDGKKDYKLRETILGVELNHKIFAQNTGLRNRLVHGEYFSEKDKDNYLDVIHKKVTKYFNDEIFKEKLITENVVGPQRNFFNNDNLIKCWVKKKEEAWPLELKKVYEDAENSMEEKLFRNYELIHEDNLIEGY